MKKANKVLIPIFILIFILLLCGCQNKNNSFSDARKSFTTKLVTQIQNGTPAPTPPPGTLDLIDYDTSLGKMAAYISPDPKDNVKHPAIIWLIGGFDHSLDSLPWTSQPSDNDQSASAFWKVGIVTMYPSFRGSNDNPGYNECMYGEVDDIISAVKYIKTLSYVDTSRIYLGGHSTGGTLALLTAEDTNEFRAVFSFGPVAYIDQYSSDDLTFDKSNKKEIEMRSPILWLSSIKVPTFIFEGAAKPSNVKAVNELQKYSDNPLISFHIIEGKTHFTLLAPATEMLAEQFLADTGETVNIKIDDDKLAN